MNINSQATEILKIKLLLHEAHNLMLVSHIRPDGDAVGSLVGMGLALQAGGKNVQMVLKDPVPARYSFLNGSDQIITIPKDSYDISITLDCSDLVRLGEFFKERQPDINIDHHITNEYFARVNLVVPEAVATSAILAEALPTWGFQLNPQSASALTLGLLTDTNGFRIPNVNPDTLRLAANLMELGANLPEIYHKSLVNQSFQTSKLWGLALSKLKKENGLVWTVITLQDREQAGYAGRDDAEITNFLTSVEDCRVAILFNEQSDEKVKVSWRSRNHLNVAKIAQQYGGGGHPNAAGAEIASPLATAELEILETTMNLIKGQLK